MNTKPTLLAVDSRTEVLDKVKSTLSGESINLLTSTGYDSALDLLSSHEVHLVLTDIFAGSHKLKDFLNNARQRNPDLSITLMTDQSNPHEIATLLEKEGFDYLEKPFSPLSLKSVVRRAIQRYQLHRHNSELQKLVSLYQVSETVDSTILEHELQDQILELALKFSGADIATVYLWDSRTNSFSLAACRDSSNSFHSQLTHPSSGPTVVYLRPQIISVPDEIARAYPLTKKAKIASLISFPLLVKDKVIGFLYLARYVPRECFTTDDIQPLSILAAKAAIWLETSRLYQHLELAYLDTIKALANAVEARDVYTRGHTERVCYIAEALAHQLGWDLQQMNQIKMGSILHDIGKIGVPDRILNKPNSLTTDEFEVMKKHPQMGAKMLEGINFLEPALPYILYHHERFDGKGYPFGLKGEDIPLEGRLMAVVDTFDAITSDRPYRKNRGFTTAIQELREHSGTQFDPAMADALIELWAHGEIDKLKLDVKPLSAATQKVHIHPDD